MKKALREAIDSGVVTSGGGRMIEALSRRHLCDREGRLTEQGKIVALSYCSLSKQCDVLGLPLRKVKICHEGKPELAAMKYLQQPGRRVCYCEGGILTLILYCLCFDRLYRLGRKHWGGAAEAGSQMYTSIICYGDFLEENPDLHERMLEDISGTSEGDMLRAYDVLKDWQYRDDGWAFRTWVGVDREMVRDTCRALGKERLKAIGETFLADPYAFTKGWPDIVCVEDGLVRLIEIKTTDRLRISQLITIPTMMSCVDLSVDVLRLREPG